jgi:hypothetical protein
MDVRLQKKRFRKKSLFGDAPVLDGEYAANVTHRRCDEHSVGTMRRGDSSTNIRAGS